MLYRPKNAYFAKMHHICNVQADVFVNVVDRSEK